MKDLLFWKTLSTDQIVRKIISLKPTAALHTDTADIRYRASLNLFNLQTGVLGMWCYQGVWDWKSRARSITHRELKDIRLMFIGHLGDRVEYLVTQQLLLHADNHPVVPILNNFMTASGSLMR